MESLDPRSQNNSGETVCAKHIITEEEVNSAKENIKKFNDTVTLKLELKSLHYPTFIYDKSSLDFKDIKNPPYGQCFTTAFNEEGNLLACGYSNGHVNIFNLNTKKEPVKFKVADYPVTSLKWNNKKQTTLLVGSADGYVTHWHASSGKVLNSIKEIDNAINSVDYNSDYKRFITAGTDITVRLYDENMKSLITSLKTKVFEEPGHSGRIFACKFASFDNNVVFSGGWDKTIQFYDVRAGKITNSIFGPEICGDSLDNADYIIASGAWSPKEQVQLWDFRTLGKICDVKWENDDTYIPTYIHTLRFSKRRDRKFLSVGAGNGGLFRLFDMNTFSFDKGLNENNVPKVTFGNKDKYDDVFSSDWIKLDSKHELYACGCGDGGIRLYSLEGK